MLRKGGGAGGGKMPPATQAQAGPAGGGDDGPAGHKDPPPNLKHEPDLIDDAASLATASTHAVPHTVCLVCYSDDLPRHRAILPCGHDDACAPCHLRLRHLHSDRRCPVCKADNERIIVDADPPPDGSVQLDPESRTHRPFDSYQMWGDDLGSGYTFRESVGMFFPTEYYRTEILPLFGLGCNIPGCDFANDTDTFVTESKHDSEKPNVKQKREVKRMTGMNALNQHLRTKHGLTLCNLCVAAKRDFVSQLPRLTPTELKKHLSKGDGGGSGLKGHPLCEFCRPRRFYDLTKLHEHLNKDHYKCHVCDKQGLHNQFFKNYDQLARHFDREHFLCHDPQCLAARFVVFENEIDLRAHEVSMHGGNHAGGSTKINLEFRVRRTGYDGSGYEDQEVPSEEDFQYGLDGEAFVPEALPERQENEPEISNAFHAARTSALREEAARLREDNRRREQAEAFPTLGESIAAAAAEDGEHGGGSSGGTAGGLVGWTSEGRATLSRAGRTPGTSMTEENFPALPTASRKTNAAARARQPRGGGAASSSFAAMRAVAAAPAGSYASSAVSSAAVVGAAAPAQTPSFFAPSSSAAMAANQQSNLSADNFPSLGGPSTGPSTSRSTGPSTGLSTGPSTIARSGAGSKATAENRQSNLTADNFPSLGGPSTGPSTSGRSRAAGAPAVPKYAAAEALARKMQQQQKGSSMLGSAANLTDFPPPQSASASGAKKAAKPSAKPPSEEVLSNAMQFPPPPASSGGSVEHGRAAVESMKSTMGPAKYKKLKGLTKDFAADDIEPDSYVNQAAALFDGGISDQAFWSFVPSLIQSCPNERSAARATGYLESLRLANEMQESEYAGAAVSTNGGAAASAGYASAAATASSTSAAAAAHRPSAASAAARRTHAPYSSAAGAAVPYRGPSATATGHSGRASAAPAVQGKKKGAWGGAGGASTVVRAKASPGSVAAAAAQEAPQLGTATKGMAIAKAEERRQKQLESQQKQGGGEASKKRKQKKKNEELRSLAFGGK